MYLISMKLTPYDVSKRIFENASLTLSTYAYRIGIVSIALGVSVMILSILGLQGFQKAIKQKIYALNGHIQIINAQPTKPYFNYHTIKSILKLLGNKIVESQTCIYQMALSQVHHNIEGILVKGIDWKKNVLSPTRYINKGRVPSKQKEIVISSALADKKKIKLGDHLLLRFVVKGQKFKKLKVVGTYKTLIPEIDEKIAFTDIEVLARLNNWPSGAISKCEIFLREEKQVKDVQNLLLKKLNYNLGIQTTFRSYIAIFDWLRVSHTNVFFFILLILLVVCTNIVSIIIVQARERTHMVGILKTLGAQDNWIHRIFFWNGITMLLKGLLWGNGLGLGGAALQHFYKFIQLDSNNYYVEYLPINWDWMNVLILNFWITIMVIFILLLTIRFLVRIQPAKAILFQ